MKVLSWIKAARPASQLYIFLPLLLGEGIAVYTLDIELNITHFVLLHLFGLFIQLYIVFSNDYADYESDKLNKNYTPYSGGSRVLVDGELNRTSLLNASIVCALMSFLFATALALSSSLLLSPLFAVAGLGLMYAYSFPPLRLSYHGAGELLQSLGVAVVLPLFAYYSQSAELMSFPFQLLLPYFILEYSCAISTSLPDIDSDGLSGKRTLAVRAGGLRAKVLALALNAGGILLLYFMLAKNYPEGTVFFRRLSIAAGGLLLLSSLFLPKSKSGNKSMLFLVTFNVGIFILITASLSVFFFRF